MSVSRFFFFSKNPDEINNIIKIIKNKDKKK